jgi:hypothetical protein
MLTLEEAQVKFPIGSKIRLAQKEEGLRLNPPLENNKIYTVKEIKQYFKRGDIFIELEKDFEHASPLVTHYDYFVYRFEPVDSVRVTHISSVTICPTCKGQEWKEVYSDWAKTNIKKCKNCGYC